MSVFDLTDDDTGDLPMAYRRWSKRFRVLWPQRNFHGVMGQGLLEHLSLERWSVSPFPCAFQTTPY